MEIEKNKIKNVTKDHYGEGYQMLSAKKLIALISSEGKAPEQLAQEAKQAVEKHEIVFFKKWSLTNKKNYIKWVKVFLGIIGLICLLILKALYYTFIDN